MAVLVLRELWNEDSRWSVLWVRPLNPLALIRKYVAPHDPLTPASCAVRGHARGKGLTNMCVPLV